MGKENLDISQKPDDRASVTTSTDTVLESAGHKGTYGETGVDVVDVEGMSIQSN